MSGTMTFSGAFDPVAFLGWYSSTNLNQRIGIGVADTAPAGGGIRWQTQSGNLGGTAITSQNVGTTTANMHFLPAHTRSVSTTMAPET